MYLEDYIGTYFASYLIYEKSYYTNLGSGRKSFLLLDKFLDYIENDYFSNLESAKGYGKFFVGSFSLHKRNKQLFEINIFDHKSTNGKIINKSELLSIIEDAAKLGRELTLEFSYKL